MNSWDRAKFQDLVSAIDSGTPAKEARTLAAKVFSFKPTSRTNKELIREVRDLLTSRATAAA